MTNISETINDSIDVNNKTNITVFFFLIFIIILFIISMLGNIRRDANIRHVALNRLLEMPPNRPIQV